MASPVTVEPRNRKDRPFPHWRVWKTADRLRQRALEKRDNYRKKNSRPKDDNDGVKEEQEHINEEEEEERYARQIALELKVADILEEWGYHGFSAATDDDDDANSNKNDNHAPKDFLLSFKSLLNKVRLEQEVDESLVALHLLQEWMLERQHNTSNKNTSSKDPDRLVVVDAACGKGIFSLLCSHVFADHNNHARTTMVVSRIVLLDKATNIDWRHLMIPQQQKEEGRRPILEPWGGCDLFQQDDLVDRLEHVLQQETQTLKQQLHHLAGHPNGNDSTDGGAGLSSPSCYMALVGIHLCRLLSPALMGLFHALGPQQCPFLCLAPCCLPRTITGTKHYCRDQKNTNPQKKQQRQQQQQPPKTKESTITVNLYETLEQRQERRAANERRNLAKGKKAMTQETTTTTTTTKDATSCCWLCKSEDHQITYCQLLPPKENADERLRILRTAQKASVPCWKCGRVGHFQSDCPEDAPRKPRFVAAPSIRLNVGDILQYPQPFDAYCQLLAGTLARVQQQQQTQTQQGEDQQQHSKRNDDYSVQLVRAHHATGDLSSSSHQHTNLPPPPRLDHDSKGDSPNVNDFNLNHHHDQNNNWNRDRKTTFIVVATTLCST